MDILTRLQSLPAGKFHLKLLLLIGLGWLFDAMDTGMVSFVLATLGKEWNLAPSELGWIVSAGFIGMALGAVLSGRIADRIGRKNVFVATMVVYSIATGLCAFAWNLESLLFFRFWVGFGLGGQLPVAVSLVSEYAPPKVRGRFIVLLESFWGLGWLAAALASYFFIPHYGWQSAFLIGALPVFYAFFVWKQLPESVPYLLHKGRIREAHEIVCRLEAQAGRPVVGEAVVPVLPPAEKIRFAQLWQAPFGKRTLMLWLIWFGIVFSYYGIFTWLPKLLVEQGHTVVKTFEYVLVMILAQLPGYFAAAVLVEKIGRKATLAGFLFACAVCAYFFGRSDSVAMIIFWGCWMSFFNLGAWGVLYTYTPELYPVRFRAFGSGWAGAVGRVGGIVAPMVVAAMIGSEGGFGRIFVMFTAVLMAVVAVIVVLGEETKGRTLEDISR
ncbi:MULTISPECIES: MFS transporter [unclassified Neisseria]|uniref:MFS transporter n=1 Tax=unclassified Neisseria TaxID=2623750 RepID=UPI0026652FD1|nr:MULTISPECIES: MFS transporter [unclassified Neisseria]MDO1510412.1 MFS transporter [Neisseria sp. MVDL19-042950]MDO1516581.1 MFS transporter [Neisseria sp. MVDL18-041461]MDO1563628.1 MFS transporter [Neisseria sp. MVDL20-010259]